MKKPESISKSSKKRRLPAIGNVYLIPLSIFLIKIIMALFPTIAKVDNDFLSDFIQAFGILYGVLLPLVLVRALDVYNNLDQEFELEANTIKILYQDLMLLSKATKKFKKQLSKSLCKYVKHVITNQQDEVDDLANAKSQGDEIIGEIRTQFAHAAKSKTDSEFITSELLPRLNELENIRVKRIGLSAQGLSSSGFQFIMVFSATLFLVPFYMHGFTSQSHLLEDILVMLLTLIVTLLNLIVEDLGEPFSGIWKVHNNSWQQILNRIENSE